MEAAAAQARAGGGATLIKAMPYRLWGHMLGDLEIYRNQQEVAQARGAKPIVRFGRRLEELGHKVAAPATSDDAKSLRESAMQDGNLVLFSEHKLLYNTKGEAPEMDPCEDC